MISFDKELEENLKDPEFKVLYEKELKSNRNLLKNNSKDFISFEQLKEESLSDPEVKAEYDSLEQIFKTISNSISNKNLKRK